MCNFEFRLNISLQFWLCRKMCLVWFYLIPNILKFIKTIFILEKKCIDNMFNIKFTSLHFENLITVCTIPLKLVCYLNNMIVINRCTIFELFQVVVLFVIVINRLMFVLVPICI